MKTQRDVFRISCQEKVLSFAEPKVCRSYLAYEEHPCNISTTHIDMISFRRLLVQQYILPALWVPGIVEVATLEEILDVIVINIAVVISCLGYLGGVATELVDG